MTTDDYNPSRPASTSSLDALDLAESALNASTVSSSSRRRSLRSEAPPASKDTPIQPPSSRLLKIGSWLSERERKKSSGGEKSGGNRERSVGDKLNQLRKKASLPNRMRNRKKEIKSETPEFSESSPLESYDIASSSFSSHATPISVSKSPKNISALDLNFNIDFNDNSQTNESLNSPDPLTSSNSPKNRFPKLFSSRSKRRQKLYHFRSEDRRHPRSVLSDFVNFAEREISEFDRDLVELTRRNNPLLTDPAAHLNQAMQHFFAGIMHGSTLGPFAHFIRGVVFGIIIFLIFEILLIYRFAKFFFDTKNPAKVNDLTDDEEYLSPPNSEANLNLSPDELFRAGDEHYHPEHWPDNIVEFLRNAMTPDENDTPVPTPKFNIFPKPQNGAPVPQTPATAYIEPPMHASPTESCHWLNVALQRFWLELRVSEAFKQKIKKKTADKISMKLQGNAFISSVQLVDILLGDHVPQLAGIRILKALTEDLSVMFEGDITYEGGACVALEVTLTSGISIPARVYIEPIAGKVRVRLPSVVAPDMLSLAFVEDPGINFRVDTPITVRENEFVRDMINKVLGKIIRKVFIEQWVLPAWRVFFLPVMEPSPTQSYIRNDIYNSNTQKPIQPHKKHCGLSGRDEAIRHLQQQDLMSINLKPSRGLPHPTKNHWDVLAGRGFSLNTMVTDSDLDRLENILVPLFLRIARESDREVESDKFAKNTLDPNEARLNISALSQSISDPNLNYPADDTTPPKTPVMKDNSDVPQPNTNGKDTKNALFTIAPTTNSFHGEGYQTIGWRTIRNRAGIHVQKKRISVAGFVSEISRGFIRVNCSPDQVFSILSKPNHFIQIEETFVNSVVVNQFDQRRAVRTYTYQSSKTTTREFTVFDTKKVIDAQHFNTNQKHDAYVYVYRTVAGVRKYTPQEQKVHGADENKNEADAEVKETKIDENPLAPLEHPLADVGITPPTPGSSPPRILKLDTRERKRTASNQPPTPTTKSSVHDCYVFGYLIEPLPSDPNVSQVTILSQYAPELQKLEVNYNTCRKLKTFIEETIATQSPAQPQFQHQRTMSVGANSINSSQNPEIESVKRIERLRNYVGNAASYFLKNRRVPVVGSWLGQKEGSVSGSPIMQSPLSSSVIRKPSISSLSHTSGSIFVDAYDDTEFNQFDETELMVFASTPVPPDSDEDVADRRWESGNEGDDSTTRVITELSNERLRESPIPNLDTEDEDREVIARFEQSNPLHNDEIVSEEEDVETPFDLEPFMEMIIGPRDITQAEVPFVNDPKLPPTQLIWEFHSRTDSPIRFQILFQPLSLDEEQTTNSTSLLVDSGVQKGEKYVIQLVSTNAHLNSAKGCLPINGFPSGKFVFIWDNSNVQKKITKSIAYRMITQPISRAMFPPTFNYEFSDLIAACMNAHDAFQKSAIVLGTSMEIVLPRKVIFRLPILYDSSVTKNQKGKLGSQAMLAWNFTTGGADVSFGITFIPFAAEEGSQITGFFPPMQFLPEIKTDLESDSLSDALATSGWTTDERSSDHEVLEETETIEKYGHSTSALPIPVPGPNRAGGGGAGSFNSSFDLKSQLQERNAKELSEILARNSPARSEVGGTPMLGSEFEGTASTSEVIIPLARYNSHRTSISGTLKVEKKGVYYFIWDNTISLVSSRTVAFKAGLVLKSN